MNLADRRHEAPVGSEVAARELAVPIGFIPLRPPINSA
jgi:hypothetical protein